MELQQCEECGKFKRVIWSDKWGKVCTSCAADMDFSDSKRQTGYEFSYKFLLMELEQLAK